MKIENKLKLEKPQIISICFCAWISYLKLECRKTVFLCALHNTLRVGLHKPATLFIGKNKYGMAYTYLGFCFVTVVTLACEIYLSNIEKENKVLWHL